MQLNIIQKIVFVCCLLNCTGKMINSPVISIYKVFCN
uniref:Beta-actin-like protein n=1 Tax=Triatoma infestans TaxID=30076 RepID=A0A161MLH9_TRIIF